MSVGPYLQMFTNDDVCCCLQFSLYSAVFVNSF